MSARAAGVASAAYSTTVIGDGEPIATMYVGVHGDESAPVRGLERLLRACTDAAVARPFRAVVCNVRAVTMGKRFVDRDLNRAFPGDPASDHHEDRLAHALLTDLAPTPFNFDIHSTSFDIQPYGILHSASPEVVSRLPVTPMRNYVVVEEPSLISCLPCAQAFEVGRDDDPRSEQVAYRLAVRILQGLGCLPGAPPAGATTVLVHRTTGLLHKRDFRGLVDLRDFEPVPAGRLLGTAVDGTPVHAENAFVPIWVNEPDAIRMAALPCEYPGSDQGAY